MRKIKLHAIGNDGDFNYYLLDRSQQNIEALSKILSRILGVEDMKLYLEDWKTGKMSKIDYETKKWDDAHLTLGGRNPRVDLFFGKKKIFLTIHCSDSLRKKFNEELATITFMSEPKRVKNPNRGRPILSPFKPRPLKRKKKQNAKNNI